MTKRIVHKLTPDGKTGEADMTPKSDAERAKDYRDRARGGPVELAPCGTYAAARRHMRHGEPMDEPCRAALAAYQADQHAKRTAAKAKAAKKPTAREAAAKKTPAKKAAAKVVTCDYCGRSIRKGTKPKMYQRRPVHATCHHRLTVGDGCTCSICTGSLG